MKSLISRIVTLSLIAILSITLANVAFAENDKKNTQIYKWTDEDGRIHYAARPGNKSAKKMHLGSNIFHDQKKDNSEVSDDGGDTEREKICQDSKAALEKYREAPFLFRYDDDRKQKVRLTEQETKDTFLRAEKEVSYWCNPPQKTE